MWLLWRTCMYLHVYAVPRWLLTKYMYSKQALGMGKMTELSENRSSSGTGSLPV